MPRMTGAVAAGYQSHSTQPRPKRSELGSLPLIIRNRNCYGKDPALRPPMADCTQPLTFDRRNTNR